jgi:hypothetical protein
VLGKGPPAAAAPDLALARLAAAAAPRPAATVVARQVSQGREVLGCAPGGTNWIPSFKHSTSQASPLFLSQYRISKMDMGCWHGWQLACTHPGPPPTYLWVLTWAAHLPAGCQAPPAYPLHHPGHP